MADFLPSHDHVEPFVEFRKEGRDLARIILQVRIHGEHQIARDPVESRGKRDRFAEIAAKPDDLDLRVFGTQGRQLLVGTVGAAVVNEQHLHVVPAAVVQNAFDEFPHRFALVAGGNDKTQLHAVYALLPRWDCITDTPRTVRASRCASAVRP